MSVFNEISETFLFIPWNFALLQLCLLAKIVRSTFLGKAKNLRAVSESAKITTKKITQKQNYNIFQALWKMHRIYKNTETQF